MRGAAARAARLLGRTALAALAASTLGASPAAAQGERGGGRRPRPLVRADVLAAHSTAAHLALGVPIAAGNYVRVDAAGGGGAEWSAGGTRGSARGDLVARFVLDPFRQSRWSGYGGGGLGALRSGGRWRGHLLAVVGVEGPAARGVLPALELGLGGATRVGIVLRRAAPDRR